MRWIVGGKAASGAAASPSQMGRFETRWLTAEKNLSALADLSGKWIDSVHGRRPPRGILLDMDSSVSPTHVPFGPRRCRHGTKSSPRCEPDMPAQLLRALFGNLTEPKEGFKSANIRKTARRASHFPASPPMSSPCAILRSRQPRGAFMGLSRGRDTRHRDAAPCSWRRAKGSVHFC